MRSSTCSRSSKVLADAAAAGDPPPLGPFRTFQVPITDIATLTGLDLTALAAVDRLPVPTGARPAPLEQDWVPLRSTDDIHWQHPHRGTTRG